MDLMNKTKFIGLHPNGVNLRLCFYQCFSFPSVFIETMKNWCIDSRTIWKNSFHREDEKRTKQSATFKPHRIFEKVLYIVIYPLKVLLNYSSH